MNILIVGAGGGACWLLQGLIRFIPAYREVIQDILIMDGDKLEERNLDRQLFSEDALGYHKSVALRGMCLDWLAGMKADFGSDHVDASQEWFTDGYVLTENTLVFCCVDNHPARKAVLDAVDRGTGCAAILCGNEMTDAEAYIYLPSWMGTKLDPRIYYPEILTDTSGDPVHPEGCQGEVAERNPQLAMANLSSANCGLHLFYTWFLIERDPQVMEFMPIRHLTGQWGFKTSNKQTMEESNVYPQPLPTPATVGVS